MRSKNRTKYLLFRSAVGGAVVVRQECVSAEKVFSYKEVQDERHALDLNVNNKK